MSLCTYLCLTANNKKQFFSRSRYQASSQQLLKISQAFRQSRPNTLFCVGLYIDKERDIDIDIDTGIDVDIDIDIDVDVDIDIDMDKGLYRFITRTFKG